MTASTKNAHPQSQASRGTAHPSPFPETPGLPGEVHISPLLSESQIQARVKSLAEEIAPLLDAEPVLVSLFKGAILFTADLVRALSRQGVAPLLDFMTLSSYGSGMVSSGRIAVESECRLPLTGRQVLLVDDILDSGRTLAFASDHLRKLGARAVLTCALLDKPERRQTPVRADFVGFTIPDLFVVGYGVDYAERFRELPYIGFVERQHALEP